MYSDTYVAIIRLAALGGVPAGRGWQVDESCTGWATDDPRATTCILSPFLATRRQNSDSRKDGDRDHDKSHYRMTRLTSCSADGYAELWSPVRVLVLVLSPPLKSSSHPEAYHYFTFGWILAGLVKRVTGESMAELLEIHTPRAWSEMRLPARRREFYPPSCDFV